MTDRGRNPNFFRGSKNTEVPAITTNQNQISKVLRLARASGFLNLSTKNLTLIPPPENLDSDEKFWEINPLTKLDLSFNILSVVPTDISKLGDLQILKLRNNQLTSIADDIFSLPLKHLDLSNNRLESISHAVGNLTTVHELLLFSNVLSTLPDEIGRCINLKVLEINDNLLSSVPTSLFEISSLNKLSLSNNKLVQLAPVDNLVALQLLDCRRNKLRRFPDLSELSLLTFLDAGENSIDKMPVLPRAGRLGRLHLNDNELPDLMPFEGLLSSASTLTELHIQGNKIKSLPPDMGFLYNLKVLDIGMNDISDIPAPIGYMKNLQRLIVDGNPLRALRRPAGGQSGGNGTMAFKKYLRTRGSPLAGMPVEEAEEGTPEAHALAAPLSESFLVTDRRLALALPCLASLVHSTGGTLDLSACLKGYLFPPQLAEKMLDYKVVALHLSGNGLLIVPPLTILSSLKSLDLSSNELGSSPPEALQGIFPVSLANLTLTGNNLSDVHLEVLLSGLTPPPEGCLSVLVVAHNNLTAIPPSLQVHFKLRELQATRNKISSLQWIDWLNMSHLETLDLSNNRLLTEHLSPLLGATSLHSLSLDNNELKDVPPEFCLLPQLRHLGLYGNPQRSIRTTVLQQGTDAILSVLRMRLPVDEVRAAEGAAAGAGAARARETTEPGRSLQHQEEALLVRLRNEMAACEERLANTTLTTAARLAVKKEIAIKKANILKIVRELEKGPR